MSRDDPLLSVSQIARTWGTGLDVVVSLVEADVLPSLDRGELISDGHFDVPLIRRSWAEFLQQDSEASGRVLEPPKGARLHPAAHVAMDVHAALDRRDAKALYALSSKASREGRDPDTLLRRWMEINNGGYPIDSGIGSTIYSLAPLPAVAARVFANAPKTPRTFAKATPALLIAVLPLVDEGGEWKVDLPLYDPETAPMFLPEVLTTPMSDEKQDSSKAGERPDPAQSQTPKD